MRTPRIRVTRLKRRAGMRWSVKLEGGGRLYVVTWLRWRQNTDRRDRYAISEVPYATAECLRYIFDTPTEAINAAKERLRAEQVEAALTPRWPLDGEIAF